MVMGSLASLGARREASPLGRSLGRGTRPGREWGELHLILGLSRETFRTPIPAPLYHRPKRQCFTLFLVNFPSSAGRIISLKLLITSISLEDYNKFIIFLAKFY